MIQALIEEMQFKLSRHTCESGCECYKARELINILVGLKNIRFCQDPSYAKFIIPNKPVAISSAPQLDVPATDEEILQLCSQGQQWCHLCHNTDCGDNINPALGKGGYGKSG
jgi:hypothetical protein